MFLTSPWPEIYLTDPERRRGIEAAEAEYSRLLETYATLGYEVSILHKISLSERANFILYWEGTGRGILFRHVRAAHDFR